ncbi:unnamed protein product [Brachionus calyciflorus]|uniref:G-protein coupled receptors family 1 profile domain-containing protein n=1 Tax=Brachionus calyciflorus TaxID=104777 RepID=A0A814BJ63_9BILA|nr:unnamed protein product [Brachionus calyciflorus]
MNSSTVNEDYAYISWASNLLKTFTFYVSAYFLPIGTLLNLFEVYIFSRKKFKKNSTMCFYFTLNSILNVIIFALFMLFTLTSITGLQLHLESDWSCRIYLFVLRTLYQVSPWLQVATTADRVLFVLFTNKFNFQKNLKIVSLILIGILSVLIMANIPSFWFYVSTSNRIKYCTADETPLIIRDVLNIALRTVIPFVLMFLMEIILIIKISKSRKKFTKNKKMLREFKFSFTVIMLSILFLIAYTPNMIYVIMANIYKNSPTAQQSTTYTLFIYLVEVITSATIQMYNACNFFIQLAFNTIFRGEVVKVLSFLFKRSQVNENKSSTIGTLAKVKTQTSSI